MKYSKIIWICLLISSAILNMYFIFKVQNDKVLLKVDDQIVIQQDELNNILMDNYKEATLKTLADSKVIQLEALKRGIDPPNDHDLNLIAEILPNVITKSTKKEIVTEAYYIYNLYKREFNAKEDIEKYFKDNYNQHPLLYKISLYKSKDHNKLMDIVNDLKQNSSYETIYKKYSVSNEQLLLSSLQELKNRDSKSNGEYYHLMLDNNEMAIAFVEDTLNYKQENKDLFIKFYVDNKYYDVRSQVLNTIKNDYEINYY